MANTELLLRFPPAARARLAELREAATEASVKFTKTEENALVALRIKFAAERQGVTL